MDVKIIETGETGHLSIIDTETGVNWINDLMGNHGELPETETDEDGWDTGFYLMSQEDFDWWADLTDRYQAANDRYNALLNCVSNDKYKQLLDAASHIYVDLENEPEALNQICDYYEAKK